MVVGVGGIDGYILQGDGGLGSPWVPGGWLLNRRDGSRCAGYRSGSILVVFSRSSVLRLRDEGTTLVERILCRSQGEATGKSSPPVVWNFVEGRGWPGSCGLVWARVGVYDRTIPPIIAGNH